MEPKIITPSSEKDVGASVANPPSMSPEELEKILSNALIQALLAMTVQTNTLSQQQAVEANIAQANVVAANANNTQAQQDYQEYQQELYDASHESWWQSLISIVVKYVLPALSVLSSLVFGPETLLVMAAVTAFTSSPAGKEAFSALNGAIADALAKAGAPSWLQDAVTTVVDLVIIIALTKGAGAAATTATATTEASTAAAESFNAASKSLVTTTTAAGLISSSDLIAKPVTDILEAAGVSKDTASIIGEVTQAVVVAGMTMKGMYGASKVGSQEGLQFESKLRTILSKLPTLPESLSNPTFSSVMYKGGSLLNGLFTLGASGVDAYKGYLYTLVGDIEETLTKLEGSQAVSSAVGTGCSQNIQIIQNALNQAMESYSEIIGDSQFWAQGLFKEARAMQA